MGQYFFDIVIVNGHVFFGLAQYFIYCADGFFQSVQGSFFFGNDFLPIPLVYVDRVDIVHFFVPADSAHVRIQALSHGKTVFFQGITFPLCKGLDDFSFSAVLTFNVKRDRAFHPV